MPAPQPDGPRPPAGLGELFFGFVSIGARAFGGVLPWAHRIMVEERRWLAPADFAEVLALCQFLPGPNIGNCSVVLGRRWFGLAGSLVAFFGLFALPFVWVLALAALYSEWAMHPMVRAVVTGVGTAGAGLFIATALKLGRPMAGNPAALAIIVACFAAVGVARITLLAVLPLAVAAALFAAHRRWL